MATITKWGDCTQEQKDEIFKALAKFYDEKKNPEWLKQPVVETEVINNLTTKKQDTRQHRCEHQIGVRSWL